MNSIIRRAARGLRPHPGKINVTHAICANAVHLFGRKLSVRIVHILGNQIPQQLLLLFVQFCSRQPLVFTQSLAFSGSASKQVLRYVVAENNRLELLIGHAG